jgi:DMSO/TMAO reductase YedYZ heme-binding membrane subunit
VKRALPAIYASYALLVGCAFVLARGEGDAYSQALARARWLGWIALAGLCAALCASPLRRLCPARWSANIARARRALGIGAAACALLHATLAWLDGAWAGWRVLQDPQLRAGACAALILGVLWATSYPRSVKRMRLRSWKELHRLAYPALAFASLHVALGPFAPLRPLLWLLGVTLGFGLLRLLPQPSAAADSDH